MAGARMRPRAGAITGAVIGNSAEAAGTGGTAVLFRPPPRCPITSDSIQVTATHDRWSSSMRCTSSITVISRANQL